MSAAKKQPSYRLHKKSQQAIVTLPDGLGGRHDVLLGPYDTSESRSAYNRVLAEWEGNGRRLSVPKAERPALTVNDLILAYLTHAGAYYIKRGKQTSEVAAIKSALRYVRRLYGDTPAAEFSPMRLKAVRQRMVEHPVTRNVKVTDPVTGNVSTETKVLYVGLTRRNINKLVSRVRRMFAWAVEEDLLDVGVHAALERVKGLHKGKSDAREKARIKPVDGAVVEQTLAHLPPMLGAMVRVQQLSAMRPYEVVALRADEIDMTGEEWECRPSRHKTEHHDRERVIYLGPRAIAILQPYVDQAAGGYLFSSVRSKAIRDAARGKPAAKKAGQPRRRKTSPHDHYAVASYRRAIFHACEKAGVPVWHPNQLRHTTGTLIRKKYSLDEAKAVLGHSETKTTQIYAEQDQAAAKRIMHEIG